MMPRPKRIETEDIQEATVVPTEAEYVASRLAEKETAFALALLQCKKTALDQIVLDQWRPRAKELWETTQADLYSRFRSGEFSEAVMFRILDGVRKYLEGDV
jgi:hypothetical protein